MKREKSVNYFENKLDYYINVSKEQNSQEIGLNKMLEDFQGFENLDDMELRTKIDSFLYNYYKNHDLRERQKNHIQRVIPELEEVKDYRRLGVLYKDLSYLHRLEGDYEASYDSILKSLTNYQKFGDPMRIAGALNSMGNYYLDTGEFNHALEYYYKAFEHAKYDAENDHYHIIKRNLANIYLVLNYYSKAKDLYIQDLEKVKEENNYERYAASLLGIAQIYVEEKRIKLAYKYAKLAKINFEKSDNQVGYATALSTLGNIYSEFEKYSEALEYYERAKVILSEINYKLELIKLHNLIGETYLKMKEYRLSIDSLEIAMAMALDIKQNFELRKSYDILYKSYEASGDKERAYEILKSLTLLNDRLFSFSLQAKVNEVQVNFELEKRELEYNKEREINEYKNNLFSYLTHEFRTPLTLISTPLELLKNETDLSVIKSKMSNVSSHILHMQHLLNQLLDINKIEEGKMPVMKKAGNVNPLLWHMIHLFEPEMHDRDIQFNYQMPKKTIQGYFDTDKIEKIISNLLSNAIKYTPEGGTIDFYADFEGNDLKLTVKDNGIGIAEEHQPNVFDKFYRIPSSKDVKGSGLGLSFVKELVGLLKGEINLESTLKKGSKFTVILPIERIEKVKKSDKTNIDTEPNEEVRLKRPTVLIVEDNIEIQKLLREVFSDKYKVYAADHGREAVAKMKKNIPDIVISDIMMPLMNGIELCNYIKQDEELSHIPVILLTAKSQVNDKILGLESGADAYITKPFNIEELFQTVDNILLQRKKIMDKFATNVLKLSNEDLISADRVFLKSATEFVLDNIENESLSVNDLAKHLNMSRFTLIRKFKKINNSTPNFFIQKIRLEKAKELIRNKVANVTEIAFKVGFSSTTYFSYSFKKEFGISPKEYYLQAE